MNIEAFAGGAIAGGLILAGIWFIIGDTGTAGAMLIWSGIWTPIFGYFTNPTRNSEQEVNRR